MPKRNNTLDIPKYNAEEIKRYRLGLAHIVYMIEIQPDLTKEEIKGMINELLKD